MNNEAIHVEARCAAAWAACPDCSSRSSRIHSSHLRFPADVPSAGRQVVLSLRVRRFFCRDAPCGRRTFVEQLQGLTRRHSRWHGPSGCPPAEARSCACSTRCPSRRNRPRGWSASTSTRRARAASTARFWSMSRPVGQWICCPTGRRPAWPSG
ncbi:transposase family protein [Streptomyces sp. NPDC059832]|uniref:transposase family protein n=1 Tax=Streptomyces sp. NPDC059832 TaxID=3346966 RepID=UPI00366542C6